MNTPQPQHWTMTEIAQLLADAADAAMEWFTHQPCSEPNRVWLMIARLNDLADAAMALVPVSDDTGGAAIISLDAYRRAHPRVERQ